MEDSPAYRDEQRRDDMTPSVCERRRLNYEAQRYVDELYKRDPVAALHFAEDWWRGEEARRESEAYYGEHSDHS